MFRRLPSGLPKDPIFPTNLQGLGYFINDKDEIRNIENPKAYFKFFLTRNERHNVQQRESMNAIRNIVFDRLQNLGLEKIRLPLGAAENEPHIPIFISSDLEEKTRIVILFYEHTQDLGILAHRVLGGKGGINEGSVINLVKYIQSKPTSADNPDAPGIILANLGQLRWFRRGKKALTQASWFAISQKSAVEAPIPFDTLKNTIPGNRTTNEHCSYIFNHVVGELVDPKAKLDVIGVSEGAMVVSAFLNDATNWKKFGGRISAFAAVATFFHANDLVHEGFSDWLQKRGRAYLTSQEPRGVFIAGPGGHEWIPAHGCPVFSLGEPYYSEVMLPKGYRTIIDWFQEVAYDPEYENPGFQIYEVDDKEEKPGEMATTGDADRKETSDTL